MDLVFKGVKFAILEETKEEGGKIGKIFAPKLMPASKVFLSKKCYKSLYIIDLCDFYA